ncbi:peptidoglycan hydrolase-like protein with peptidoglycan-binding domain [Pantoea alhagi]|uniref:peptidoglycan-binding protein n=1 Tax=Mixta sp. BE291 TaxID=3158787 RepID=UPI0028617BC9|nr:peptidoglycan hydrolase-like protein with peptidoglycan-binding domain [Pantoea alhagi]
MRRKYHDPMVLHPDRLFTSVGTCGTNQASEVKKLQRMVMNAGYRLATGRQLSVDGICGQQTVEAIRWYQRLLNLSPSGLVTPLSVYFMDALTAMSPDNQLHEAGGLLRVSQGQFTFDNEGRDYRTVVVPFRAGPTPWFSRVLHWPGGHSGVTLGRGFDMKMRSAGEIYSTLRQAGLEEHKAVICSRATGLSGRTAEQFVTVFGPMIGEITHQQQIRLFDVIYPQYVSLAKGYYFRHTKKLQIIPDAVSWEAIDSKIKDVYIDIVYQGVDDITQLVKAVASNDKDELKKLIKNTPRYMQFEKERKRIGYL